MTKEAHMVNASVDVLIVGAGCPSARATFAGKAIRLMMLAVLVIAGLFFMTFAIPVHIWRTGELPAPPLPLTEAGAFKGPPQPIWIDTDAACGIAMDVDVDDCFALLLLAQPPRVGIDSISTV